MRSQDKVKDICMTGLFLALAVIMGYIEAITPINVGMPGIKPGLCNCVILFVLYRWGIKRAVLISALRTIIIALLFTSPAMLMYSFTGAVCSLTAMALLKKSDRFSVYGVSAAGGTVHNITQYIVAVFISGSAAASEYMLFFYLPVLLIAGELAGLFNAFITDKISKRLFI